MVDHGAELREAARAYRRARERTEKIMKPVRTRLADSIRVAYSDGMRKADILRAIEHVWSRQWVDETLRDL